MMGRGKGGTDWDEDFNDTSCNSQYPDDDARDGVQLDHTKLYITNLPMGLAQEGLLDLFRKFGNVEHSFVSRDPSKKFAIVKFETAGEARVAMMKLNRTEPLKLNINIAHKKAAEKQTADRPRVDRQSCSDRHVDRMNRSRDDASNVSSKPMTRRPIMEDHTNGVEVDNESEDSELIIDYNSNLHYNLETLKLKQLELKEKQLRCQERILLIQQAEKMKNSSGPQTKRRILPNGQIVVSNSFDVSQDNETGYTAGAGDSNETTCSCQKSWTREDSEGSSTPSTCVLCSEDQSPISNVTESETTLPDNSKVESQTTVTVSKSKHSKVTDITKKSDATSKCQVRKCACSNLTNDLKFRDFYAESDNGSDETNRLILMRNSDYLDIVDDDLKVVVALAGYPKSKMRLRQMDLFQRCLNEVIEMQAKAGLLLKDPSFLDYYLNRGAIVCICRDIDTRDWLVRITPGLQERMCYNLVLLNAKVRRLCLAVLKIPRACWPATAQDAFKLLQYFNPSLKTNMWKVYAQKIIDDVECTSFLIDRVSGEIIRGPSFKNIIDYDQMDFELTGYTEIYYECLLSGMEEDLSSVASRVKLLEEIKSTKTTPRIVSTISLIQSNKTVELIGKSKQFVHETTLDTNEDNIDETKQVDIKTNLECTMKDVLKKIKDVKYYGDAKEVLVWSDETIPKIENRDTPCDREYEKDDINIHEETEKHNESFDEVNNNSEITIKGANVKNDTAVDRDIVTEKVDAVADKENKKDDMIIDIENKNDIDLEKKKDSISFSEEREIEETENPTDTLETNTTTTSLVALSEKTVSYIESNDNLFSKSSTINIDSNRGIAYHRRTNYLHVENELKVAITLEGYPVNKLEGTHIRRVKHLFKEYLHKDMKAQRFTNMIIPKFQDVYLSNGAVIYICDSLETKDYLTEVLPKFINSTGLKLTFRDVKNLVRYTRIVMRLPKEQAHIESIEILTKLQEKYPKLKPDCWKCYSDVAGKQKREFGVDPDSLEIIKSPDFDPVHDGEKLTFRIIDRKKRDISCGETKSEEIENAETKKLREYVAKNMYSPIDPEILNAPLTRIRANHYTDLIADDFKLYVGPRDYPDTRIDETQFYTIKRTLEHIVVDNLHKNIIIKDSIPALHDIYLFDGVIFVICKNIESRVWIEKHVAAVNDKLKISLKSTEFRGAVGIVSMMVQTSKDTDYVIDILQKQNPRLRTKYWRKISTDRTDTILEAVLQIDKLSAEVIIDPNFNKMINNEPAEFKLGHLKSLIKPKQSLEELTKELEKKNAEELSKSKALEAKKKVGKSKTSKNKCKKVKETVDIDDTHNNSDVENNSPKIYEEKHESEVPISGQDSTSKFVIPEHFNQTKIILKIPMSIVPESEDDLDIIFDILEDKNPGLNTEIWEVYSETEYPCNGRFILYVDKQSISVIQSKSFVPLIGGEKLKFFF